MYVQYCMYIHVRVHLHLCIVQYPPFAITSKTAWKGPGQHLMIMIPLYVRKPKKPLLPVLSFYQMKEIKNSGIFRMHPSVLTWFVLHVREITNGLEKGSTGSSWGKSCFAKMKKRGFGYVLLDSSK